MATKSFVKVAAVAAVLVVVAGCGTTPGAADGTAAKAAATAPKTDRDTSAALERILAGPHRSEANRARDRYRHPKETLQFFGVREDMTVMEVWPGAGGWWTEILAPLLKDEGRYVAASWDPKAESKFIQDGLQAFRSKLDGNPELYGRVEVVALQYPGALSPVPPGTVDMVVTFRNLHNWMGRDGAAPAMLKAIHDALKPGGILGVKDHRANPDAPVDPKAKGGYVNERHAIDLIEAAGFEFLGSSEINANPKDTRDHEQGVWTLPPTYRLGDKDREKYAAIGESDRFTLKFRKAPAK